MTLQQLIKVKYYLENELWKKQQEIEELKQHILEISDVLKVKCNHTRVIDDYENVKDIVCKDCGLVLK